MLDFATVCTATSRQKVPQTVITQLDVYGVLQHGWCAILIELFFTHDMLLLKHLRLEVQWTVNTDNRDASLHSNGADHGTNGYR